MMIYVTTCLSGGGTCSSVVIFNGFPLVQIFAASTSSTSASTCTTSSRRKDGN